MQGFSLPPLKVNFSPSICAAHYHLNLVIWPYLAWLPGSAVTFTYCFPSSVLVSLHFQSAAFIEMYSRGPATAHFHITGGGDFIDLLQKAGVSPITRASSVPASLAVKKKWFVALTPMVLYIALKQDAVPLDNEHWSPEHKQRFYCAPHCEPPDQCFVNHPRGAHKHRSSSVQPTHLWDALAH